MGVVAILRSTRFLLLLQVMISAIACLAVAWVTAGGFEHLASNKAEMTARYAHLETAYQLQRAVDRQVIGLRGYMVAGRPSFLAPFSEGQRDFDETLARLRARDHGPIDHALMGELEQLDRRYRENARVAIALREGGRHAEAFARLVQIGEPLRHQLNAGLDGLIDSQKREIAELKHDQAVAEAGTGQQLATVGLVIVPLSLALALLLIRRVASPLSALTVAAASLGAGNLSARATKRVDDEFGALADAFNAMAGRLEQSLNQEWETQDALRESQERYRDLFDNATDLIQMVRPDGRFDYVNRAWLDALGYAPSDVAGLSWWDVVAPECRPDAEATFARVLAGEDVGLMPVTLRRRDGGALEVEGHLNAKLVKGRAVTTRGMFRDVTARREVERMKDEFLSVVSHELRTPLTSIRGSLSLLANGKLGALPDRAQRMLEIAANSSARLVRLINDILDIERLSAGHAVPERRACDMPALLAQAAGAMRGLAIEARVDLAVGPADGVAWANADQLMQVLTNLVSNAVKFSAPGQTVRLGATVHATPEGDRVRVTVADEGRGIPESKLESIFERFEQVDGSDARDKGGTGLGLAICRMIVTQHGGRIWAESAPGAGATLSFELPAASAAAEVASGPLVLVCDDDDEIREVVGELVRRHGGRVAVARTGGDAIAVCQQEPPDGVVLDVGLPGRDGFAVVDWLRRHDRLRLVPLAVYSGLDLDESDRARLQLGPTEFWVKGRLEPDALEARLIDMVRRLDAARKEANDEQTSLVD